MKNVNQLPKATQGITESIVGIFQEALKDSLVGVYVHSSAAMGCFNPKMSDLDLLVVVTNALSED
ncbi:MAG: nucleotidyltransferase domain-containing protein [Candidatus Uhrbacteria bacterium]